MAASAETLKEIARQCERVVDHEITAIEQLAQKTHHLLSLALGGLPVLFFLSTLATSWIWLFHTLLVVGGLANGYAIYYLGRVVRNPGSGVSEDPQVGPDLAWLEA